MKANQSTGETLKKLNWLKRIGLKSGAHSNPKSGACLMEAVSYVAGEAWSDHPQCASPVIAAFARRTNDWMTDKERRRLKPYVLRLVGTRKDAATERKLAYFCADWAVREVAPMALDAASKKHPSLAEHAAKLRALPELVDGASAEAGRETAQGTTAAYAAAADAADADAAAYADAAAARSALVSSRLVLLDRLITATEGPEPVAATPVKTGALVPA